MAKATAVLEDVAAFTRADLIKAAIIDGLMQIGEPQHAAIVERTEFDFDPFRGRVMAYCPRRQAELDKAASDDMVRHLEDIIELGLKVHGFGDPVWVEP